MSDQTKAAIPERHDAAVMCPDCEEPIGSVERYCWNCDAPVENPATVPHPEDTCQRCGGRNPVWWVDSDRYNTAVNRSEIVCPTCFVFAHEAATGMRCTWRLVPDGPFRWIDGAGRPTPFLGVASEATCEFCGRPAPEDQFHTRWHDEGAPMRSCDECLRCDHCQGTGKHESMHPAWDEDPCRVCGGTGVDNGRAETPPEAPDSGSCSPEPDGTEPNNRDRTGS